MQQTTRDDSRRGQRLRMQPQAVLIILAVLGSPAGLFAQTASKPAATALNRPLDAIAAKLEPSRIIAYKNVGDRPLHLHVFEPAQSSDESRNASADRRPVFLAIHGGGWTGGNPRRFYPFAAHFAERGMVGISLEYRLLNRAVGTTVFDCVKDGRSAVRYLRSHADELGIDPRKIVVAGGSAGAHVAVGTALFKVDGGIDVDEEGDGAAVSCLPNALVLYYPVIDTSAAGYGQQKIGARWRELSPVHNVRPNLPPCILFHGTGDTVTPFEGAKRFHDKMLQAENVCELVAHEGGRHGYFIFDLELFDDAMKRTENFLRVQQMLAP